MWMESIILNLQNSKKRHWVFLYLLTVPPSMTSCTKNISKRQNRYLEIAEEIAQIPHYCWMHFRFFYIFYAIWNIFLRSRNSIFLLFSRIWAIVRGVSIERYFDQQLLNNTNIRCICIQIFTYCLMLECLQMESFWFITILNKLINTMRLHLWELQGSTNTQKAVLVAFILFVVNSVCNVLIFVVNFIPPDVNVHFTQYPS